LKKREIKAGGVRKCGREGAKQRPHSVRQRDKKDKSLVPSSAVKKGRLKEKGGPMKQVQKKSDMSLLPENENDKKGKTKLRKEGTKSSFYIGVGKKVQGRDRHR